MTEGKTDGLLNDLFFQRMTTSFSEIVISKVWLSETLQPKEVLINMIKVLLISCPAPNAAEISLAFS